METDQDVISVIVPVFNGAKFITEALHSILAQEYTPLEIIVVDDGSTDETALAVQSFGASISYHYQENSGSSAARNHGIRLAQGHWLAFLDADDVWAQGKLHRQMAVFQQDPTIQIVWGHVIEFSNKLPVNLTEKTAVPGYHPGTMLIRRDTFAEIGRFSEAFKQVEVADWVTRVMQNNIKQKMLPDVLMYRRLHGANKGNNTEHRRDYLYVLKQHLEQQRANKE